MTPGRLATRMPGSLPCCALVVLMVATTTLSAKRPTPEEECAVAKAAAVKAAAKTAAKHIEATDARDTANPLVLEGNDQWAAKEATVKSKSYYDWKKGGAYYYWGKGNWDAGEQNMPWGKEKADMGDTAWKQGLAAENSMDYAGAKTCYNAAADRWRDAEFFYETARGCFDASTTAYYNLLTLLSNY